MQTIPPSELSIGDYHAAAPRWLSKTSLRDYGEHGPAWWKLRYIDRAIPNKRPDGALQGMALDCLLTEGLEQYMSRFIVRPEGIDLRTTAGKQWRAANEGKEILGIDDGLIIEEAAEAVTSCCEWNEIEDRGLAQHTLRWETTLGFGLQSRPDWISRDGKTIWDLKKTHDLSRFGKQAVDLGYHLQAAIAVWCLRQQKIAVENVYLIAVEWERWARCNVYRVPQFAIEGGENLLLSYATDIGNHMKSGNWTHHQDEPEDLPIPDWQARSMT